MKWFGESWGAPACAPEDHVATPFGKPCLDCGLPIADGDVGVMIPHLSSLNPPRATIEAHHLHCFERSILGESHPTVIAERTLFEQRQRERTS